MEGVLRRDRGGGRRAILGERPPGVVLDDVEVEPAGDAGERVPAFLAHGADRRIGRRRHDESGAPVATEGRAPVARPGNHVLLCAEMDCVVVTSACPQDLIPVNGENMAPVELHAEVVG